MQKNEENTKVRFEHIGPNEALQRIDNYLVKKLKGVPKSHLYNIIRKGNVRINKKRVKANYQLQEGDSVRIPPVRQGTPEPIALAQLNQYACLKTRIIYEDASLLVLNKPAGIAVHGGSGVSLGIIEALRAQRKPHDYLELVHRLDKETSGCLLIAKKRSMLRALHELLRNGQIEKSYLTFLTGDWIGPQQIEAPLLTNTLQGGERVVRVDVEGKAAMTDFSLVAQGDLGALVLAKPFTGRTHQIRVHAQFMKQSVALDQKYGIKEINQVLKQKGLARLFLHAQQLVFTMPGTDKVVRMQADLDEDLRVFLKNMNIDYTGAPPNVG